MKLIGFLLVMLTIAIATYYLAGDYLGVSSGGSEAAHYEPMKEAAHVAEKVSEHGKQIEEQLQKANK